MRSDRDELRLSVARGPLARPLILRLMHVGARRAGLRAAREADALEAAGDALARTRDDLVADEHEVMIHPRAGGLELHLGALVPGAAERAARGGDRGTIGAARDVDWHVEHDPAGDRLVVAIDWA